MTEGAAVPYRDRLPELEGVLVEQGSLGALMIDVSHLAEVERNYGRDAFQGALLATLGITAAVIREEVRRDDLVTLSDNGGDALLVFLSPRRDGTRPRLADLEAAAARVERRLHRRLAELPSPYLPSSRREAFVGFGLAFWTPLVLPERRIARLVSEAAECIRVKKQQRLLEQRCRLQEILLEENIRAVFQPVVSLRDGAVLGYEALARGPAATPFYSPTTLFDYAATCDLLFELDRACRTRALADAAGLPAGAKLFVNVVPASLFDPGFRGAALLRLLERQGLEPGRMVLEITERHAIENYELFIEAAAEFTAAGVSIAVDDIGAGYSGLEKIARLNPRYLKLDMHLVREIHKSPVRGEMARALKGFADRMDSTVIAEGVEQEDERAALLGLGIDYGQGFLLGLPAEGFGVEPPRAVAAAGA